jgi:hypothetical protein
MKPSMVTLAVEACIEANRPFFIHGPAGIGKSALVDQVAVKHGLELRDERASQLDAVSTRGLPKFDATDPNLTIWTRPELLPTEGKGILFLDELNTGLPAVQNALLQLVRDRKLGKYKLGDGWRIGAAGNRTKDRGHIQRMSGPLANRFTHLNQEPDLDDLRKIGAQSGWEAEVLAFLSFRPDLIHAEVWADETERKTGQRPTIDYEGAFASPRTWEGVSDLHKAIASGNIVGVSSVERELYEGTVGAGAAIEFVGFLQVFRRMPSLDGILMNPTTADVPEHAMTLFAIAGGLARRSTPQNFDRVMKYAGRMRPEVAVALVKQATARLPELQNTNAFINWAAANSEVVG